LPLPSKKPVKRKLKRRSKLYPETEVQVNVLKWLALYRPAVRKCVIRIENEGKRTAAGNALALNMGMYSGAADLFIAWPNGEFAGLFLEVKPPGYKATPSKMVHHQRQLNFIMHMKSVGYHGDVGVGFDECVRILEEYLN
jgi:hypothetical protein